MLKRLRAWHDDVGGSSSFFRVLQKNIKYRGSSVRQEFLGELLRRIPLNIRAIGAKIVYKKLLLAR